jgi:transcriptional regulator with XRE-family HTH domain
MWPATPITLAGIVWDAAEKIAFLRSSLGDRRRRARVSTSTFGELLRRYRIAKGISQERLAEIARLSAESVGALERGVRRAPYRDTVDVLATALELAGEDRAQLEAAAATARVRVRDTREKRSIPGAPPPVIDVFDVNEIWNRLDSHVDTCRSLEEVARCLADVLYEGLASTAVLVRVFATVEFQQLAADDRSLVESFARSATESHHVHASTPVLTLLATRGVEKDWNDRRRSREHRAIPLLSRRQVCATPMIARLLEEIGFMPNWRGSEPNFVVQTLSSVNGIFYVPDAGRAVDDLGRKIIPATTFVESYGLKTVFGFGGSYEGRSMFLSAVAFCRDEIPRAQAARFVPLIARLKARTEHLLDRGAIFSARSAAAGDAVH